MLFSVEIYSEKPFFINEDSYINTHLKINNQIFANSIGKDIYNIDTYILSGKRIAGIAHEKQYTKKTLQCGLGYFEAAPGGFIDLTSKLNENIYLNITNNFLIYYEELKNKTRIRLINENGKKIDIPLSRPDIKLKWIKRGKFSILISNLINKYLR